MFSQVSVGEGGGIPVSGPMSLPSLCSQVPFRGYPSPSWGVPLCVIGLLPPGRDWGTPLSRQEATHRIGCGRYASWVFTQEDFLVFVVFYPHLDQQPLSAVASQNSMVGNWDFFATTFFTDTHKLEVNCERFLGMISFTSPTFLCALYVIFFVMASCTCDFINRRSVVNSSFLYKSQEDIVVVGFANAEFIEFPFVSALVSFLNYVSNLG